MIRTEVKNIINEDWKIDKISALDIGEVFLEDINDEQSDKSFALTGSKDEAKIYELNPGNEEVTNTDVFNFQKNKFGSKVWSISQRALQIIKGRFFNGR